MRLLALILVLSNLLYFVWSNGLLRGVGFAPTQQDEPLRMRQQIAPQAVRLLTPQEFQAVEQQVQAELDPKECLLAGPFDESQMTAVGKALTAALPAGSWQWDTQHLTPRWIVYMGKYPSQDVLLKKRTELQTLNLKIETLVNPTLEPGFSLGAFETKALADAALLRLNARGVRTAHVLQERAESTAYQLRLAQVNAGLKAKLGSVKPALGTKALRSCS